MTTLAKTPHSGQASVPEHSNTASPLPTSTAPTNDSRKFHTDTTGINASLRADRSPRWPTLLYYRTHNLQHQRRVNGITAPFPFMGTPVILASARRRHTESYELLSDGQTKVDPTSIELVFLVECNTPTSSASDDPALPPKEATGPLAQGYPDTSQPDTSDWLPIMTDLCFRGLHSPCVTQIDGRLLVGGTRDRPHENHPFKLPGLASKPGWRQQMSFYLENHGDSSFNLAFHGPEELCGIRLVQLQDGRILVLHPIVPQIDDIPSKTGPTSPTEAATATENGLAYRIVDSLDDLSSPDTFTTSRPVLWCAPPDEPHSRRTVDPADTDDTADTIKTTELSPCEVTLLANGCVGILALQHRLDTNGGRHCHALTFCLDPETGLASTPSPLAERKDFPAAPTATEDRSPSCRNFQPGGLVRMGDGHAILYASLDGGACGCTLTIPDPFIKYEAYEPPVHPHRSRAETPD